MNRRESTFVSYSSSYVSNSNNGNGDGTENRTEVIVEKVLVNDNGKEDVYLKKAVIKDGKEKIINEEDNKNLTRILPKKNIKERTKKRSKRRTKEKQD